MPLFLEAAILPRMRSPVTSRSNWANDNSTLRVSRPRHRSRRTGGFARRAANTITQLRANRLIRPVRECPICRRDDGGDTAYSHVLSKSLLGLLTGILVSERILDPDRQVTTVIPEVSETAYKGATIRQLLDMRTGVAFDEDYTASSGPDRRVSKSDELASSRARRLSV